MIIFKKQDIQTLIDSRIDRSVTNISSRRDLAVQRCRTCGLLFQTFKMYPHKNCALCRYENSPDQKEKIIAAEKKRGNVFNEKGFYEHALKIHHELQIKKDRINEAFKVTTINAPECVRII